MNSQKAMEINTEELNTQESSENTNKQECLIKRIEVKGTPFTIVGDDENGYFGAMGGYKITENKESIGLVSVAVKAITWNRIVQVIMILQDKNNKLNE